VGKGWTRDLPNPHPGPLASGSAKMGGVNHLPPKRWVAIGVVIGGVSERPTAAIGTSRRS